MEKNSSTKEKVIRVRLTPKAEQYLANVLYGLEVPDGKGGTRRATQSEAVNECLEVLFDFEEATDDQLVNWLEEKYQLYSKRKAAEKDSFVQRQLKLINELNKQYGQ